MMLGPLLRLALCASVIAWSPAHLRAAPRALAASTSADPFADARLDPAAPDRFGEPFVSVAVARHPLLAELLAALEEAVATTDDPASTDEKNGEWGDNPTGGGRERDGTWMLSEDRARVVELADRFTLTPTAAAALAGALDEEPSADTDTGASAASALARASRCARVGIARAPRFDVSLLSLPAHEEAPRLRSTQPSGTIVVYKLLFGSLEHCSLRSDRAAGWVPRPASARRVASPERAWTLLGGPPREFAAQGVPALILEVALRPPGPEICLISGDDGAPALEPPRELDDDLASALRDADDADDADADIGAAADAASARAAAVAAGTVLSGALGERVGGLDAALGEVARRVFASRAFPYDLVEELGLEHVKGLLLYGPPGCGKTLVARELARALGAREPKIVSGPEILDKFVGVAEEKVRSLFVDAEAEWAARGAASALHVVVLDEMDAICRSRGALVGDTTGVRDSVVNQLLAKMDGISTVGNLLVVGLTNRKELIDPALLRPGRFEVHVKVGLPDAVGREQILRIQMRALVGRLAPDARARALGDGEDGDGVGELARLTEGYSGAELAGVVRSASSFALARHVTQRVDGGGRRGGGAIATDPLAAARHPGAAVAGAARVVAAAADDPRAGVSLEWGDFLDALREVTPARPPSTHARRVEHARYAAWPELATLAAHWASGFDASEAAWRPPEDVHESRAFLERLAYRERAIALPLEEARCDELARHLWCYLREGPPPEMADEDG